MKKVLHLSDDSEHKLSGIKPKSPIVNFPLCEVNTAHSLLRNISPEKVGLFSPVAVLTGYRNVVEVPSFI
jgi:hypothetical protein